MNTLNKICILANSNKRQSTANELLIFDSYNYAIKSDWIDMLVEDAKDDPRIDYVNPQPGMAIIDLATQTKINVI